MGAPKKKKLKERLAQVVKEKEQKLKPKPKREREEELLKRIFGE